MKKVTEVTRIVKREEYYCDVCGNLMDSLDLKFCDVCNKHLCKNCTAKSDVAFGGESPSYYCRRCWNVGDMYRDDIEAERDKRDRNIEILESRWVKAAKRELL